MTADPDRLNALMGKMLVEMGAATTAPLVLLGEELGLFKTVSKMGPASCEELATASGVNARYMREWLGAMAASGYVSVDETERFSLTPEQHAVFAADGSPTYLIGGFMPIAAAWHGLPKLTQAFRSGEGIGWGEHCSCLFCGTERFFRGSYQAHLLSEWLPALEGMVPRLENGARVLDIGCGHGASTVLMADAFPRSEFLGIDPHARSIEAARRNGGSRRNIRFEIAHAQDFAGHGFDLAAIFDALHDMGDPIGAARHARSALGADGTLMVIEPRAGDHLADNLHPVGRLFYAASTQVCVPAAMSQPGGMALGAQAGERRLRAVLEQAGFSCVRRAAETPFSLMLEARF